MSTSSNVSFRLGRRMLWSAPWLAIVVLVLSSIEQLRAAVERSGNSAAHELPGVAVTSAAITTIVAYWVALGVAQACAVMLDRWFDEHGWVPRGSRVCLAVVSGTALLTLVAEALATLGPGAGEVPTWARILLGGTIVLLAGLHLNRGSSDRPVIIPALTALPFAGVAALSF